ncbi:MAG: hypothetical protein V4507_06430 [Verrucomicrobiota bacterium]
MLKISGGLLFGLSLLGCIQASAATIYLNNFGSNSGYVSLNGATVGWNSYTSTTASPNIVDTSSAASTSTSGIFTATGASGNLANVNAPTSANTGTGYGFVTGQGAGTQYLAYTSQYTVDRSTYSGLTLSWFEGDTAVSSASAVVQIGGSWYISGAQATPTVSSYTTFPTQGQTMSVALDTATWSSLTVNAGSPFSVGSVVAIPTGNITAFGLFIAPGTSNSTSRFDNFTITSSAIPEPSGFILWTGIFMSSAFGLLSRRTKMARA